MRPCSICICWLTPAIIFGRFTCSFCSKPSPEALLTTNVVPASLFVSCFLFWNRAKEKCIVMKNIDKPYESPKANVINFVGRRCILQSSEEKTYDN